jgi:lipopolysaccharide/colanic/teichoic acid biosynthesis glycosyltransferase
MVREAGCDEEKQTAGIVRGERMAHKLTSAALPRPPEAWYLRCDSQRRLIRGSAYRRLKRAIDLLICLLGAPLVLPLLIVIALLIRIDSPGSIVFRQMRTGKGGRRFRIYKFRTMVSNAEELKLVYAHLNELAWPDFKITNDPRVTRVGRILRRTSLDELPQLLNVIKGDMSLVGPRPTDFSPETYRLWHTKRLEVPPGITGLGQVCGRANLEFDQRLRLDIIYIDRQSIWLDVQIMARTALAVFSGEGAY